MILEIARGDGTRSWHRLDVLPLTLGRGLSNDLILDDPYVDARHARIRRDDDGGLHLEDLGSVNGVVGADDGRQACVALQPGVAVRVGRTTLRFRDAEEDVGPALVDERRAPTPTPAAPPVDAPSRAPARFTVPRWATRTSGQLAIVATTAAAFACYTWLGNSTRSPASDVFAAALGFTMLAAIWAGLWSVAGRIIVQRFHFVAHLAVIGAVAAAGLCCTILGSWLTFLFPDVQATAALTGALMLALLGTLIAGHLAFASAMPTRRRWTTGLVIAGVVFGIGFASSLAKEDAFSDVPRFPATLEPLPTALVPTKSVDQFGDAMAELQRDVDKLAREQAKRDSTSGGSGPRG
jgi:hypothetical protein